MLVLQRHEASEVLSVLCCEGMKLVSGVECSLPKGLT